MFYHILAISQTLHKLIWKDIVIRLIGHVINVRPNNNANNADNNAKFHKCASFPTELVIMTSSPITEIVNQTGEPWFNLF